MKICIVDDIEENAKYLRRVLASYETVLFTDPQLALDYCLKNDFDILFADQKMEPLTGLELAKEIREEKEDFLALIISAYTDSNDLIDAVNSNIVYRYIIKPVLPEMLLQHTHRALEHLLLMRSNRAMQTLLEERNRFLAAENKELRTGSHSIFDVFTGTDPAIRNLMSVCPSYASSDKPVLISGETGTGKELLARVIHQLSPRSDKPFLALNCSAIAEHLAESELFGYRRGAFTGAESDKRGLFELADGGSIFFDEIGETPLPLQPKLLRALQFGTFTPVGSTKEIHVNARIIAATNKELLQECRDGRFREDLFYRISAFQLHLPPLRERKNDIPKILDRISKAGGKPLPPLSVEAKELLCHYSFPGNVRELENIYERILVQTDGLDRVDAEIVKLALYGAKPVVTTVDSKGFVPHDGEAVDLPGILEDLKTKVIEEVLRQENGNVSRTARRIGMTRQGLRKILDRSERRQEVCE